MQRRGLCNRCGQCCGAEGSPNQDNPWPRWWARKLRDWDESTLPLMIQVLRSPWHGGPAAQVLRIAGTNYRVIWVEGRPCKDLPPYGDDSNYSLECPFLMDDPGDGVRPCALVGSPYEYIWVDRCQPAPPEQKNEWAAAQWAADYPLCSYRWE